MKTQFKVGQASRLSHCSNQRLGRKPILKKEGIGGTLVLLCLALLLAAFSADAQIVNDGATNTLSNVTNSFTGDVTVGTNGSFTLLILTNNALLTNGFDGILGRNA